MSLVKEFDCEKNLENTSLYIKVNEANIHQRHFHIHIMIVILSWAVVTRFMKYIESKRRLLNAIQRPYFYVPDHQRMLKAERYHKSRSKNSIFNRQATFYLIQSFLIQITKRLKKTCLEILFLNLNENKAYEKKKKRYLLGLGLLLLFKHKSTSAGSSQIMTSIKKKLARKFAMKSNRSRVDGRNCPRL